MVSTSELLAVSQSSVLLPQYRSRPSLQGNYRPSSFKLSPPSSTIFTLKATPNLRFSSVIRNSVVPEKPPTALFVEGTEVGTGEQLDNSGGGGDIGGSSGGGGGGGDNNWGGGSGGGEGEEDKKPSMSMSQKLTLGYAALVGMGGLMGYLKSGSQKSLLAGGISAALLFYVYTQLPVNPVFASSIGLGLSAALLVVMGSRFKKSGKVFPAGVVSVVSFVMTGGYIHGVMRSFH